MLILKSFFCSPELWKRLSIISEKRKKSGENCSVSELIRKAIINFLKREKG